MGFRDHFRSTKRSDDRTSSISSSSTKSKTTTGTTTPNPTENPTPLKTIKTATDKSPSPAITLTKSHSLLGKTLTWHSSGSSNKPSKKEAVKDKQVKAWEKEDAVEWSSPMSQRPGRKDKECQNTLRAFDFRTAALGGGEDGKGRSLSAASDVSPSQSRVGSVDDGLTLGQLRRSVDDGLTLGQLRRSGEGLRKGKLNQEIGIGGA